MTIRDFTPADLPGLCEIYNYYIENTVITFEEVPLTVEQLGKRVAAYTQDHPWLVGEENGALVGYAYAGKWHERSAYRHSVEVSVYLRHTERGRGHGTTLYRELLNRVSHRQCHVIIGGIALPNEASVRLHEKFGFTKAAHYREVGWKFGKWIDVGYWQKILPDMNQTV